MARPGATAALGHINRHIYVLMQGPSEMGASGRLVDWDRFADLKTHPSPDAGDLGQV